MSFNQSVDKGAGSYSIKNNKFFFDGFYSESYVHKIDVLYHVGDTLWTEILKDTVYNFKQIKRTINEEYFYCFKGDTLILDCDKKYGKKYFVREK